MFFAILFIMEMLENPDIVLTIAPIIEFAYARLQAYVSPKWMFRVACSLGFLLIVKTIDCLLYRWQSRRRTSYKVEQIPSPVFTPEKMMPNSKLMAGSIPAFQAQILTLKGERLGQGALSGNAFITAFHVIDQQTSVVLETQHGRLVVAVSAFERREGDLAVAELNERDRSTLQLKSAKLHPFALVGSGVFVQVNANGLSSLGFLESHRAFGFVKYSGSTVNGFSGAPYYVGNTIYGFHVGGSSENVGYEASYVKSLLFAPKESSEDIMMDAIRKKRKFKYERSPFDPDEYRVLVGDRYYMVDSEAMGRLLEMGRGSEKRNISYEPECEYCVDRRLIQTGDSGEVDGLSEFGGMSDFSDSGNDQGPSVIAGATGKVPVRQVVLPPKPTPRRKPPSESRPKSSKLTDGRKLMLAQRNEALRDIAECLRKLRQEQTDLLGRTTKKLLTTSENGLAFGELMKLRENLSKIISKKGLTEPSAN